MPFTKITAGPDKGKFRSPSGKVFTSAQVRAYYASKGFKENAHKGAQRDPSYKKLTAKKK